MKSPGLHSKAEEGGTFVWQMWPFCSREQALVPQFAINFKRQGNREQRKWSWENKRAGNLWVCQFPQCVLLAAKQISYSQMSCNWIRCKEIDNSKEKHETQTRGGCMGRFRGKPQLASERGGFFSAAKNKVELWPRGTRDQFEILIDISNYRAQNRPRNNQTMTTVVVLLSPAFSAWLAD